MDERADRIAGGALVGAAGLTMLVLSHHPTDLRHLDLGRHVHGALIALACIAAWGFAHVAMRRGIARPAVLAGLIAYFVALFANIGGATINGFVVPSMADKGPIDPAVLRFAWESNQALIGLAVAAMGAAYLLWSIGAIARPGMARFIGLLGIVAGIAPAAILVLGLERMNVSGALIVFGLQTLWMAAVGIWLVSGRFAREML